MNRFSSDVLHERAGHVGWITLNRPQALNALSLGMVRELTHVLTEWQHDPEVWVVAVRGSNKQGPFGAFCAGGDIRYFHQAALAGDASLEDFFTEEYCLNHLIQNYPKPYIAFMDGIVMGGGMGISQGAAWRVVTERTLMAMPETQIGLFPDVGGGYFLSRCPGHSGEYLALTGQVLHGADALTVGLADVCVPSDALPALWAALRHPHWISGEALLESLHAQAADLQGACTLQNAPTPNWHDAQLDRVFALPSVGDMVGVLSRLASDQAEGWAAHTLQALRQRSPLMLAVSLEQIRRGRHLSLADDLRMERDLVRHCFHTDHLQRRGAQTETVEGIRALAIDKDRHPQWQPARIEDVTPEMVAPFFASPWPEQAHPLRPLA
ncbi:enoyl-CoA hydratase/isomerase family protein [Limnohabitans sp.]|uniref:enoyl-CoA hydratase/isomerase family protein n=1 Tax=Limnohabitans sp. TaxID=1907725 RepID=UPI0038B83E88